MVRRADRHLGETDRADSLLAEAVQRLASIDRNRQGPLVAPDLSTLALALAAFQGEKSRAIALAEEATRIVSLQNDKVGAPWHLETLCEVLALTGERDRALEIMAQLIDMPGTSSRWVLYLDPR